jgi:Family of unknown function (DUF6262)
MSASSERARPLVLASAAKRRDARARVTRALHAMQRAGEPISFLAVARRAGVSRTYLYDEPELRAQIGQLRGDGPPRAGGVPSPERASERSLLARNRALLEENQRLREEIGALKGQLAVVYAQMRQLEERAPR